MMRRTSDTPKEDLLSGTKILVVDDNARGRHLLRATIELEEEYEVMTAADGREALELAGRECPGLVLMDLHMPVWDGYRTTTCLKANPKTADIPVIALTASHVMGEDLARAMEAGCVDYLQKPVPRQLLLDKVHEHIRA